VAEIHADAGGRSEDRDAPQSHNATRVVRACLPSGGKPGRRRADRTMGGARRGLPSALERELASAALGGPAVATTATHAPRHAVPRSKVVGWAEVLE
jgi:hypothetical protein